ncbi:hypothetical protein [Agarilytica rhodophyticola]|uniref:hypothetical protein n=1 Tax=Agarilytica rhodophyticola TaxID=1737490 RepID=UPI000B348A16|nr:hypothetical protein [Agarilytica rhodophyticola]
MNTEPLKAEHLKKIESDFSRPDCDTAISLLSTIKLDHVMAYSQHNLDNTRSAILQLSGGDLAQLESLVTAAKKDFRDVIYWASLERNT